MMGTAPFVGQVAGQVASQRAAQEWRRFQQQNLAGTVRPWERGINAMPRPSYTPNPHRNEVNQCQGCGAWGDKDCDYCGNSIERA